MPLQAEISYVSGVPTYAFEGGGRQSRWKFTQGDATVTFPALAAAARQFEYLFIDAEHTAEFAHFFTETIFGAQTRPIVGR